MTEKIVRGTLLHFRSVFTGVNGGPTEPDTVKLYLNYVHADGTTSTDSPIIMDQQTDGSFHGTFDTSVAEPGAAFASIRAENPSAAEDIKFTITANAANPDP